MRVALDATPLLGRRTGVGRYVAQLAAELPSLMAGGAHSGERSSVVLTAFTARGAGALPRLPGTTRHSRPVPARLLRRAWMRGGFPPVEMLAGRCDVFHATNFVLPPTHRAGCVLTVHDLSFVLHPETVDVPSRDYLRLVPRALERRPVLLTPSAAAREDLVACYGVDRDDVLVTPLGVGPDWFTTPPPEPAWLRAHGLPEHYLLFVGTVEPRKNLPVLLAAHARLRADRSDVPPLVLAGPAGWGADPGPPALGAGGVVRAGWLEDDELRSVVAGARALVLPSRYEGFGLPPLEALATGRPVVVSDIPVLREVSGEHAVYAAPGDVDSLAAALEVALDAPDDPLTRAGRRRWASTWTWRACAEGTLAGYERALGAR